MRHSGPDDKPRAARLGDGAALVREPHAAGRTRKPYARRGEGDCIHYDVL
jgi:hypothetical protein